jgi:hypothetical protein
LRESLERRAEDGDAAAAAAVEGWRALAPARGVIETIEAANARRAAQAALARSRPPAS